ncbi:hypothetical protein LTS12_028255, partial [Elasticomyces elasticus]
YRFGNTIPLLATPFADDLTDCLVYLDEAHTRGTDLKLPANAKAALTLGLNQTKDHTVQAAMRMRKLGTTQSITFIAPPEVHQSILDVCSRRSFDRLDSSHVITWLLDQTCTTNQELQSLYFAQGKDFCQRTQAAKTWSNFLTNPEHRDAYMEVLRQQERQDLELYSSEQTSQKTNVKSVELTGKLGDFEKNLQQRQHWSYGSVQSSALEEVEQEREVAFEVEEEREVQRPRRLPALRFPGLCDAICEFITTGVLSGEDGEGGYTKASDMLDSTELGKKYGVQASSLLPRLYVSDEFMRTVGTNNRKELLDNYTRSVNWVLWSTVSQSAMVIIPEEAELLIPQLRAKEKLRVHLLLYAAPVTRKMLHFNKLNFYATPSLPPGWKAPPWLSFELGILSGRLYFDFADYEFILHGLRCDADSKEYIDLSGAVDHEKFDFDAAKSTLAFLMEWLSIRRQ